MMTEALTALIECEACDGRGEWEVECCSGAGGCSCRGGMVQMGACHVCNGTGWTPPDLSDEQKFANCRAIMGAHFIGSGPSTGVWVGEGVRLNK